MNKMLRFVPIVLLVLVIAFSLAGCSSSTPAATTAPPSSTAAAPATTATPAPSTTAAAPASTPTATKTSPPATTTATPPKTTTPQPVTIQKMADAVAKDVGKVMSVTEQDKSRVVFVFEEAHNSRLGQVEIAIMFNRLYSDYGLTYIGLEGQTSDQGPLDLSWAHPDPPFKAGQMITSREDVIIQMLKDGELSAADAIGTIYSDVVCDGIDDPALYSQELSVEAMNAPAIYLYNIALKRMTTAETNAWQALYDAKKLDEAFDFAIGTDDFCANAVARLNDSINILQDEEWAPLIADIKAEAAKTTAKFSEAIQTNLNTVSDYYVNYVSRRSDTMAANTLKITAAHPGAPVAMNIGASHTAHVAQKLAEGGVSVVVVRAMSMANGSQAGLISNEAFQRKMQGLSVDPEGFLGSFLDGRKKPESFTKTQACKNELLVRELTQGFLQLAMESILGGSSIDDINKTMSGMSTDDEFISGFASLALAGTGISSFTVTKVGIDEVAGDVNGIYMNFEITMEDGTTFKGKATNTTGLAKSATGVENRLELVRKELLTEQAEETEKPVTTSIPLVPEEQQICSNTRVLWTD